MKDIIIDELIRSKRKSVSLIVTKEARLLVRAPLKLPVKDIERIVQEKIEWIKKSQKRVLEVVNQRKEVTYKNGEGIPYLGEMLTLKVDKGAGNIKLIDKILIVPLKYENVLKELLGNWYRHMAEIYLCKRLAELSSSISIPYGRCRITNARKRWGSCNSRNDIQLAWRLVMADKKAVDYVIIHELCHVVHKNHSKDFWHMVEKLMPEYSEYRIWLKENSYLLDLF